MFDNPEPLITLAALAGATERIRLQTEVLLGPLRSTALLAKQVSTIDHMSGSRFVLGIGVGGRADDQAAAGTPLNQRGRLLDRQLDDLHRIWRGDAYSASGATDPGGPIGPQTATPGGPPILIGAFAADYYAFTGHPGWDSPISEPDAIAETIDGYRQLGVDELVLYCYSDNADQIEELADLAL